MFVLKFAGWRRRGDDARPVDVLSRLLVLFVMMLLLTLVLVGMARAASSTPQAGTTKVSLTIFWQYFLPVLLAVVTTLGGWAMQVVASKTGLNKNSQLLDDFDQAWPHGVAMLEHELESIATHNGAITVPSALAGAVTFIQGLLPAIAGNPKLTPDAIANFLLSKVSDSAKAIVAAHVAANGQVELPTK